MKKTFKLSILVVLLVAITSCNQTNKKMMELIPESAGIIVSINPSKVIDHTGVNVDGDGKLELPGNLGNTITESDKKQLEEGVQKIMKAGADLSNNIYVYITYNRSNTIHVLATTKDATATKAVAEKEGGMTFKAVDGIEMARMGDSYLAIKDDIVVMADNVKDAEIDVKEVFAEKEKNATTNSDIEGVLSEDKDINVYINYESAIEMAKELGNSQIALISGFLTGIKGCGYNVDLSDNKVAVKGQTFVDENADIIKLLNEIKGDASNDFMEFMPADANILFSLSLKGEKLAEFASIKPLLEAQSGNPMLGNANLTDLVKSLDGPIAVGVCVDKEFNPEKVKGSVVITTTKPNEWKALLDGILKMGGMPYQVVTEVKGENVIVKFGVQTNFALNCSNDKAKSVFSDNYIGFCMDLNNNGKTMHMETGAADIKHGEGVFYILNADGKEMAFVDYPEFFESLK